MPTRGRWGHQFANRHDDPGQQGAGQHQFAQRCGPGAFLLGESLGRLLLCLGDFLRHDGAGHGQLSRRLFGQRLGGGFLEDVGQAWQQVVLHLRAGVVNDRWDHAQGVVHHRTDPLDGLVNSRRDGAQRVIKDGLGLVKGFGGEAGAANLGIAKYRLEALISIIGDVGADPTSLLRPRTHDIASLLDQGGQALRSVGESRRSQLNCVVGALFDGFAQVLSVHASSDASLAVRPHFVGIQGTRLLGVPTDNLSGWRPPTKGPLTWPRPQRCTPTTATS